MEWVRARVSHLAREMQRDPQGSLPDLNVGAVITISQANYPTGVVTLIGCNQNPNYGPLLFVHVVILRLMLPYGGAAGGIIERSRLQWPVNS